MLQREVEWGGQEEAGDGVISFSVKALQLGKVGNTKKRKPCG